MASADSGESKPAGEEGAAANPEHINLKVEHITLELLLAFQVLFIFAC